MPREARGLARILPTSPYLAHDPRHDRDVAIKILHLDLGARLSARAD